MGLGQSSNKTYLSVADGKIIQKVGENTPNAIKYTKEDGSVIYQLKHSYIEGFLIAVNVTSKEFNGKPVKQWNFDIEDGQDVYQLQIKYSSGYATSLLKALLNPIVNTAMPIKFTPWAKTINDKKKTSIYVSQNGEDIPWYFTRDISNGLPEMKQVVVRGETIWDDYDMMQFLETQVKSKIVPNLFKTAGQGSSMKPNTNFDNGKTPEYAPPVDMNNPPDEDDLPF